MRNLLLALVFGGVLFGQGGQPEPSGNMLPVLALNSVADSISANIKISTKADIALTGSCPFANFSHIVFGKLRGVPPFPDHDPLRVRARPRSITSGGSSFGISIGNVFQECSQEKMLRIAALWIVSAGAVMADLKLPWVLPGIDIVGSSVGHPCLHIAAEVAIPTLMASSEPWPAGIRSTAHVNLFPESHDLLRLEDGEWSTISFSHLGLPPSRSLSVRSRATLERHPAPFIVNEKV